MVFSQNTETTPASPAQFNGRHYQAGHRDTFAAEGNLRTWHTTSARRRRARLPPPSSTSRAAPDARLGSRRRGAIKNGDREAALKAFAIAEPD